VEGQMERMMGKYHKKVHLKLLPPALETEEEKKSPDSEETVGAETKPKVYTLRAEGSHRQTMKRLAADMIARHNNIVQVLNNIIKN